MTDSIDQAMEAACEGLPIGWTINVSLEYGAAYVTLSDGRGNRYALPDPTDRPLSMQITDALTVAKEKHYGTR